MTTLKGDIQSFSLAAVNRMIHSEKKTGRLSVVSLQHQAEMYYQKGLIVFLDSELTQAFSLGQLVLTHNIIGDREMRRALELANSEGRRLGVTLVKLGYLSKEKLVNLLHYQFKEVIATVLSWRAGSFSYTEGLTDHTADIRFEIDPVRLLSEAQQWRQYRDIIPDDRAVFKMADTRFLSDSSFSEGVLRVMLLINGQRTIMQIIAETGFSRLAVYKAVKQLVSRGAIANTDAAGADPQFDQTSLVKRYLDAVDEIMSVISLELGRRRSLGCLQDSLHRSAGYDTFLNQLPIDTDAGARFGAFTNFLRSHPGRFSEEDLINGFDSLVGGLLADVQQMLGERAYAAVMEKIDYKALSEMKSSRSLTGHRQEPSGTGRASQTVVLPTGDRQSARRPAAVSDAVDRSVDRQKALFWFFSTAVKTIVQDLEDEIGLQARSILQGILEKSDAYPLFLKAFEVDADSKRNANRMAARLKQQGVSGDVRRLEQSCHDALAEVVAQARTLLGNGAVQWSLDKVGDQVAGVQDESVRTRLRKSLDALQG